MLSTRGNNSLQTAHLLDCKQEYYDILPRLHAKRSASEKSNSKGNKQVGSKNITGKISFY